MYKHSLPPNANPASQFCNVTFPLDYLKSLGIKSDMEQMINLLTIARMEIAVKWKCSELPRMCAWILSIWQVAELVIVTNIVRALEGQNP